MEGCVQALIRLIEYEVIMLFGLSNALARFQGYIVSAEGVRIERIKTEVSTRHSR